MNQIRNNFDLINDWKNINELIPEFYLKKNMQKTGLAGIFAATLELSKEGLIKISQEKIFDKVLVKKST